MIVPRALCSFSTSVMYFHLSMTGDEVEISALRRTKNSTTRRDKNTLMKKAQPGSTIFIGRHFVLSQKRRQEDLTVQRTERRKTGTENERSRHAKPTPCAAHRISWVHHPQTPRVFAAPDIKIVVPGSCEEGNMTLSTAPPGGFQRATIQ